MRGKVLLFEPDEARRRAITSALAQHAVVTFEAPETSHAMAALGRAEFVALVATESTSPLSLKGMCLLARKRHPLLRIIILASTKDRRTLLPEMGIGETFLDVSQPMGQLARAIVSTMLAPMLTPFDVPTTDVVWETLERASQEQARMKASPNARPPELVPDSSIPKHAPVPPAEVCSIVGDLADMGPSALLMTLLAQGVTGALHVLSPAAGGALYFYKGDPVWSPPSGGDVGMLALLLKKGLLPQGVHIPLLPEGLLISHLVAQQTITADGLRDVVANLVRERVAALLELRSGEYRFREERGFMDTAPLLKANIFGLILDAQRRRTGTVDPGTLLDRVGNMAAVAGPALEAASPVIKRFVRNNDIHAILERPVKVTDLITKLGMDRVSGGLMMAALVDARLVTLRRADLPPPPPTSSLEAPAPKKGSGFDIPDTTISTEISDQMDPRMKTARNEVFGMYFRLKPLVVPHEVLGVPLNAPEPARQAALHAWMQRLDSNRVPAGPGADELKAHLEELRWKVTQAYLTLRG